MRSTRFPHDRLKTRSSFVPDLLKWLQLRKLEARTGNSRTDQLSVAYAKSLRSDKPFVILTSIKP